MNHRQVQPASNRCNALRRQLKPTTLALSVLLLAGCGGNETISSIDDAKQAVIRIVATGTFVDASGGLQLNAAGTGSGFIIDPSGIAVTNNHVVTGAATLNVYVGGSPNPVTARVLGVSECADLAVIDLNGEGYPYLAWNEDKVTVNTDVRSAGFPLGDPEYTMTRGIVSKASAAGDTPWASVDAVIEHDARINPGNSGGPLLDDGARVVGVNYAGRADTAQNFSIAAPLAKQVVDQLRQGKDVHSIGINGKAFVDPESKLSGIWVASVQSGSPASKAGIQSGDIITRMESLALSTDGTMKTYCDILKTRGSEAVLMVEVLRVGTQEMLVGELNGKVLSQSVSFAESAGVPPPAGNAAGYDSYVEITDETGILSMKVPAAWNQVNGANTEDGEPALSASHNLQAYVDSYDVSGVILMGSRTHAKKSDAEVLEMLTEASCVSQGRKPYDDSLYRGTAEFFNGCGGAQASRALIVARPSNNEFVVIVDVQITSDADMQALDAIVGSFVVNPQ